MSTERSPQQPQRHFKDAEMKAVGCKSWERCDMRFGIFEGRSFAHGALRHRGSGFIRQETEPLSLSAFSFKPAATPCQSWFRRFGALKREQCSMTDVSLHINTCSSKLRRKRADAEACPSVWSRLTGCFFIPAFGDEGIKDLMRVRPGWCAEKHFTNTWMSWSQSVWTEHQMFQDRP